MPYRGKVTTGGEVLPELYEISARCQTAGRMNYYDVESAEIYASADAWLRIEVTCAALDRAMSSDSATPDQVRNALLDLATDAVRWAREIREQCQ